MNLPTVKLPEVEVRRYKNHGLAHLRMRDMDPVPLNGCVIDLEPLLDVEGPKYYWVKQVPIAPQIIIASGKAKSVPDSAQFFDPDKNLGSLVVQYWHAHIKKDYTDVKLMPEYTE